jgi:hypothetical protein
MGIRKYKEWSCATGDSATYFVPAEPGLIGCQVKQKPRRGWIFRGTVATANVSCRENANALMVAVQSPRLDEAPMYPIIQYLRSLLSES